MPRDDERDRSREPVPLHRLAAHELPGGAVLLAFDLRPRASADDDPLDALTPGQARVARLALEGLRDEQIASALGLSRHTVSNQLRRAYARLGVNSRIELAAALRWGGAETATPVDPGE